MAEVILVLFLELRGGGAAFLHSTQAVLFLSNCGELKVGFSIYALCLLRLLSSVLRKGLSWDGQWLVVAFPDEFRLSVCI